MLEWFVLRTLWQQEQRAERELNNQNVKTFLPMARTERRRASDGLLTAKVHPLFPRYLFVQLRWEEHKPIMFTRGVHSFVGYYPGMDKAPVVRKGVIKELRSRLEEVLGRDVIVFGRPEKVEPGMIARILWGPFTGHLGLVESIDDDDRAKLILELFGVKTPIKLPRDILTREGVTRISLPVAA